MAGGGHGNHLAKDGCGVHHVVGVPWVVLGNLGRKDELLLIEK